MTKRSLQLTGLDIGSSRISAVAADFSDGACTVRAHASQPSRGVLRGAVVDLPEAVSSVSKVLAKLSEKMGRRPENIYVTISGQNIRGERSRGMIPLSIRGREVTSADIDRCINVASTIQLPFDRDILHKVVQYFSIDDQPPVKNPTGLYASRLACEMFIITANINHIQNIYKCVNNAGYDVREVVFTGMGDSSALLDEKERNDGSLVLHMGSLLTEASFFYEGTLHDMEVIPIGSDDIGASFEESLTFDGMVAKVKSEIDEFTKRGGKLTAIVLTGGLAFADGIIETLEERFPYPIRMGLVKDVRGDISSIDSIRLATSVGLVKYAYENYRKKVLERRNIVERLSNRIVDIFNNYF
jgi:cell division protein FtsA